MVNFKSKQIIKLHANSILAEQFIFPKISVQNVKRQILNAKMTFKAVATFLLLRMSSKENMITCCYNNSESSKITCTRIYIMNGDWIQEQKNIEPMGNVPIEREFINHSKISLTAKLISCIWPNEKKTCFLIDIKGGVHDMNDLFKQTLSYVTIKRGSTLYKGVPGKLALIGNMGLPQYEEIEPREMWQKTSIFPRVQWFTPDANVAKTFAQIYKTSTTKAYIARFKVKQEIKLLNLDLAAITYLKRLNPQIEEDITKAFPIKKNSVGRHSTHESDLHLFGEICALTTLIVHGVYSDKKFLVNQELPTKTIVPTKILERELALCNAFELLELVGSQELVTEMVNELSAKETGDNEEKKRKRENESKGEKFEKRAKNGC